MCNTPRQLWHHRNRPRIPRHRPPSGPLSPPATWSTGWHRLERSDAHAASTSVRKTRFCDESERIADFDATASVRPSRATARPAAGSPSRLRCTRLRVHNARGHVQVAIFSRREVWGLGARRQPALKRPECYHLAPRAQRRNRPSASKRALSDDALQKCAKLVVSDQTKATARRACWHHYLSARRAGAQSSFFFGAFDA
jgi:hypothetical protein